MMKKKKKKNRRLVGSIPSMHITSTLPTYTYFFIVTARWKPFENTKFDEVGNFVLFGNPTKSIIKRYYFFPPLLRQNIRSILEFRKRIKKRNNADGNVSSKIFEICVAYLFKYEYRFCIPNQVLYRLSSSFFALNKIVSEIEMGR